MPYGAEVEERGLLRRLYQKIEITLLSIALAGDRAEHAHIAHMMSRKDGPNLGSMLFKALRGFHDVCAIQLQSSRAHQNTASDLPGQNPLEIPRQLRQPHLATG